MVGQTVALLRAALALALASQSSTACSTDLDCSLNGVCVNVLSRQQQELQLRNPSRGGDGNRNVQPSETHRTLRAELLNAATAPSVCVCDKPWTGDLCDRLVFVPVRGTRNGTVVSIEAQGYGMVPNVTTWGGGILAEKIVGNGNGNGNASTTSIPTRRHEYRYHLYVSRMTKNCPLDRLTTNSRIDHAVSDNGIHGPYRFVDVAIPTVSHNPAPIVLGKGRSGSNTFANQNNSADNNNNNNNNNNRNGSWRYAIFHIGQGADGPNGGIDCRDAGEEGEGEGAAAAAAAAADSAHHSNEYVEYGSHTSATSGRYDSLDSAIHVSESLDGPWIRLTGHDLLGCNNPAPWVHPSNGTLYVACGDGSLRASPDGSVEGPYRIIGSFPDDHRPSVTVAWEDPCLYTDRRGNFHCLYHAYERFGPSGNCTSTLVAAHAYSKNGIDWLKSPNPPYGPQVEVAVQNDDGDDNDDDNSDIGNAPSRIGASAGAGATPNTALVTLASRERPKLFFGRPGMPVPTHLVEAVCGAPSCDDPGPWKPWCVHCKYRSWDFTLVSALDADADAEVYADTDVDDK